MPCADTHWYKQGLRLIRLPLPHWQELSDWELNTPPVITESTTFGWFLKLAVSVLVTFYRTTQTAIMPYRTRNCAYAVEIWAFFSAAFCFRKLTNMSDRSFAEAEWDLSFPITQRPCSLLWPQRTFAGPLSPLLPQLSPQSLQPHTAIMRCLQFHKKANLLSIVRPSLKSSFLLFHPPPCFTIFHIQA